MLEGRCYRAHRGKGEEKWGNCNGIINKIYKKKKNRSVVARGEGYAKRLTIKRHRKLYVCVMGVMEIFYIVPVVVVV